jgi:Na+/H+ antiporter NhaC
LKNIFFFFSLFIIVPAAGFPQTSTIPHLVLQDIEFSVNIKEIPDTVRNIKIIFEDENYLKSISFDVQNSLDTSLLLSYSGNLMVKYEGINIPPGKIRVIPGVLSVIPPLLAIALALILRQVIVSLLLGIFIGAVFVFDYNLGAAFLRVIDTYIINALFDKSHIQVIAFTFLFGGVIGLISKSGGTQGIANLVIKFAKTRRSGLLSTWASGLLIFFDDYSNALIVGNLMRPITDKLKISREKLAFIVDSTSAPVASIFLISSWIGFEIGLIQDGLNTIGSSESAYDVFIQTIPYRFYPIAMLIFVFMIAYTKRDFGSMYKAEQRAYIEDKLIRDGAKVSEEFSDKGGMFGNEERAKWYNGLIPILILIFGTITGLVYTGISSLEEQGISSYGVREIIGSSNSYSALLWSSFIACVVAGIMILFQKIMVLSETIDAWFTGMRSMFLALIILTLAWSIGTVTTDMKTADYIVSLISDSVNPGFLPVIIFLACALTSFATGTSWGTMAVMMPIVIPLGAGVSSLYGLSSADQTLILYGVVSSVLAGSVFGDHCSPIADTTILSSMASGCDHMDHVRTQLPYALVVGFVCMLLGDLPTAFGFSPYLSIVIISGVLFGVLFFVGKKTD